MSRRHPRFASTALRTHVIDLSNLTRTRMIRVTYGETNASFACFFMLNILFIGQTNTETPSMRRVETKVFVPTRHHVCVQKVVRRMYASLRQHHE